MHLTDYIIFGILFIIVGYILYDIRNDICVTHTKKRKSE
jgi:hypothetical protein